ncbi:MAG TPA: PepSY-associated TM helix domain-containing protein [Polyangiales bacterium]|nr:PepSY-associated TM helix domain-containing protein [Polyangiales bacterium]
MKATTTRKLLAWHRWCGLIVSLNVALFAVTGVLLIFHEEIDDMLGVLPAASGGENKVTLAQAIEIARAGTPGSTALWASRDPEHPHLGYVGIAPAGSTLFADSKATAIDLTKAEVVKDLNFEETFSGIVLALHAQLMMGPPGALLVGVIGLAFLFSLISGVILYGPMMVRFRFGLLRKDRALRTLMGDLHKLLGITTFGWNLVVVSTGVLLSVGSMMLQYYAATELQALASRHGTGELVTDFSTVDAAVERAEATSDQALQFVALPGSEYASASHYAIIMHGKQGLSKRMLTLALVDARSPTQVEHHAFPLYLQALMISEPLHFGDYGGYPLKIVWSLFALLSLGMALSGVWITVSQRKQRAGVIEDALSEATP